MTFIVSNIGTVVGTYYFQYIVGDIKQMSVVGLLGLVTPLILIFCPLILKKISTSQMIMYGSIIGVVGYLIRTFAGNNMGIIVVSNLITTISILPLSYFGPLLCIDIMDYHEYKTGNRVEAVFGAIYGLSSKLGAGLASGLVGLIMGAAGFNGLVQVQSEATIFVITALYSWIPAILMAIAAFCMSFFNLYKNLPNIKEELARRREV
ncbi:MFS transporter [Aerococcaceae bacterium zg-ZJ1578]|uniref:MFS transporter n=1 Tax=Aerococcaceae bacterium zg-252 TaxID=2796928 RepID=UPI001A31F85B|nr:MFS transporter [Aerococcaceae bacterium zg-1578]